jgi:uncharacterized protein YbjT (DUF2867 family)
MRAMATITVLGATGKTGRRVADLLEREGHAVRRAARGGAVRFDWDDPATWEPALAGADALYLVPPAMRADASVTVEPLLERRLVPRVVALSARGVHVSEEIPLRRIERAVERHAGEWAVVRPTWFMQNFTEEPWFVDDGVVRAPAGEGRVPFVDAADIAAVAAALLTGGEEHLGRAHELSGPEALAWDAAAAHLGLAYADTDPEAWVTQIAHAVPAAYARGLVALLAIVRDGHEAHLSSGVPDVLGRPPRSFAAFATDAGERAAAAAAAAAAA